MNTGFAHSFCDFTFWMSQLYAFYLTHAVVHVVGFAHDVEVDEVADEGKLRGSFWMLYLFTQ